MKSHTFIIASHVFYADGVHDVHGPAHTIYDFLVKKHQRVTFIKHCIENRLPTVVQTASGEESHVLPTRSFLGAFVQKFRIGLASLKEPMTIYIGVDPFNGLLGVAGKLTGKIRKFIYYSPDYTDRRFDSYILNVLYYLIDRIDVWFADDVWSVSSRISQLRRSQGVADRKNKVVPNTPDMSLVPRFPYDGNKQLVIVSNMTTSLFIEHILSALVKLHARWPDIRLIIYGGRDASALTKLVTRYNARKLVTIMGSQSHETVLMGIAHSFLGFALYTNQSRGTYWGDSMKAREYVACSIPVIINSLPATADDIRTHGAGIVLDTVSADNIYASVAKCIRSPRYYASLRKNAYALGRLYDKSSVLQRELFG